MTAPLRRGLCCRLGVFANEPAHLLSFLVKAGAIVDCWMRRFSVRVCRRLSTYQSGVAFTIVEAIVALAIFGLLLGMAAYLFGFAGRAVQRLTPKMSLQQAGRKAIARMLIEIQEGIEVLSPRPGLTLSYAILRDKRSTLCWFFQCPQPQAPAGTYTLWVYTDDQSLPPEQRQRILLTNIRRLTFTSRSEGALQINLALTEEGHEYSILTTVRLRNIAFAEEIW